MAELTIDKILKEQDGTFTLGLTQPDPWDSPGVMAQLHKRLNEYIYTIQQGLVAERYPECRGKRIGIRLYCYHPPSAEIHLELDRVNAVMLEFDIAFRVVNIVVRAPGQKEP